MHEISNVWCRHRQQQYFAQLAWFRGPVVPDQQTARDRFDGVDAFSRGAGCDARPALSGAAWKERYRQNCSVGLSFHNQGRRRFGETLVLFEVSNNFLSVSNRRRIVRQ